MTAHKSTHEIRLVYGQTEFTAADLADWLRTLPEGVTIRGVLAATGLPHGERLDGLIATVNDGPAAEPTQLVTPFVFCPSHQPIQHRDGKEPWCHGCGMTAAGRKVTSKIAKEMR